jgi:ribonuclease HI
LNLDLYTDGSYFKNKPNTTYGGIVIVNKDTNELLEVRRVLTCKPEFTKMNNAGGEVIAAWIGMFNASSLCNKEEDSTIRVFYDYKGVREFLSGGSYVAGKSGNLQYVHAFNLIKKNNPKIKFDFIKVKSHSGNRYNDLADSIAKGYSAGPCSYALKDEIEL